MALPKNSSSNSHELGHGLDITLPWVRFSGQVIGHNQCQLKMAVIKTEDVIHCHGQSFLVQ
jgi:hypothetical protein